MNVYELIEKSDEDEGRSSPENELVYDGMPIEIIPDSEEDIVCVKEWICCPENCCDGNDPTWNPTMKPHMKKAEESANSASKSKTDYLG